MKSFVYFSAVVGLIFTLSTFTIQDAHAIGGTISDDFANNILKHYYFIPYPATISINDVSLTESNQLAMAMYYYYPTISINDVSLTEGNSGTKNFIFTVTRAGYTTGASSVNYATGGDGTATVGSDYTLTSGTLNFASSETTKTITIVVNGDIVVEPDEIFNVNLSSCVGCNIVDSQGVGTILNDDSYIGPSHFMAIINGANEVSPTPSTATGFGTFSYDDITNELTYDISFSGLSSAETGAHIHEGAVGVDGPIIFVLPAGSPKTGTVTLSTSQETSLLSGGLYVNIHSTNFSGGEIRGQIIAIDTCTTPTSGDWIVTSNCLLESNFTAPANVIVQNNSVLVIPSGVTLDVDFATKHLLVQSGSKVWEKSGGKIT